MKTSITTGIVLVCFALTVTIANVSIAGTPLSAKLFTDNIEDGSATDGMPVSWVAPRYADTGSREVIVK